MSILNEKQLTGAELVARLNNSPERVVARLSYQEQKTLLGRVVLGECTITESVGAALLDALRVKPHEVGAAIEHAENMRRRNAEGLANWKRLQVIEATLAPLIEALRQKAIETFGEDYEMIQPPVFEIDYRRDRCEVFNAPVLQPLADAVTAAMQGRNAVARFAQMIEETVHTGDLFGLADRRRELAADAARRIA